jgi:metallophosphoesterase (TIGR00282 family)
MAKILLFGDIMGRPGRAGLAQVLPEWRAEFAPDLVTANVENLAHGKGVTESTLQELQALGVDVFTSGNHVFDTGEVATACFEKFSQLIRPHNYTGNLPGTGFYRLAKQGQQYLVINLSGRVFFEKQFRNDMLNPFTVLDDILQQEAQKDDIIVVDLHAEASSEKTALPWYGDGRVTVAVGTHTHVPTADTRILPKGTATQADIGMTGAQNSVLGVKPENSLDLFLERGKFKVELPEDGPVVVNAVLVETDGPRALTITRLQKVVQF